MGERRRFLLLFTFVLASCYLLFFHRLADRDLWSSHEARAAMDASSILAGDDLLVPRLFDGRLDLQKPPLYYWLVAGFAQFTGGEVDAWAVRLPSAFSALACVAALIWLVPDSAGIGAACVLATAAHFTWLARIGRIDMPLAFTTSLAALAFYRAEMDRRWLALAYPAMAVGVMLKGPIGLVLPLAIVASHLLFEEAWPALWEVRAWWMLVRRLGIWWGLPLVLTLTLPWFFAADADTDGEFFRVFIWYHNVERGLGGGHLRSNPWWFYATQFMVDFLPWSPLVLAAAVWVLRTGGTPSARFGLAWFVGATVLLSCAQFKRADYLLPAYPGAALLLAGWLRHFLSTTRPTWLLARALPAMLALGMVGFWFIKVSWILPAEEPFRDYRPLAQLTRQLAPAPTPVLFFRTEAHALAFRVGRPLAILVEFSALADRLRDQGPHYVVMPPAVADDCRSTLTDVRWETVADNRVLAGGAHERPLLLVRAASISGLTAQVP